MASRLPHVLFDFFSLLSTAQTPLLLHHLRPTSYNGAHTVSPSPLLAWLHAHFPRHPIHFTALSNNQMLRTVHLSPWPQTLQGSSLTTWSSTCLREISNPTALNLIFLDKPAATRGFPILLTTPSFLQVILVSSHTPHSPSTFDLPFKSIFRIWLSLSSPLPHTSWPPTESHLNLTELSPQQSFQR